MNNWPRDASQYNPVTVLASLLSGSVDFKDFVFIGQSSQYCFGIDVRTYDSHVLLL